MHSQRKPSDSYAIFRGILRDPSVYPRPEVYDPERFLKDGKLHLLDHDPADMVFGFGKRYATKYQLIYLPLTFRRRVATDDRVCTGMHLAQESILLLIAQFLSVFEILTPDGGPAPHVDVIAKGTMCVCVSAPSLIPDVELVVSIGIRSPTSASFVRALRTLGALSCWDPRTSERRVSSIIGRPDSF